MFAVPFISTFEVTVKTLTSVRTNGNTNNEVNVKLYCQHLLHRVCYMLG